MVAEMGPLACAQPRCGLAPAIFFQTAWTEAWSRGISELQRLSHEATSSTLRETAGSALGPPGAKARLAVVQAPAGKLPAARQARPRAARTNGSETPNAWVP